MAGRRGREVLEELARSPMLALTLRGLRLRERYASRSQASLVSVVMPTWNRASLLEDAIDSVLGQSYRNLELLVVDDGSRDDTAQRLARRQAQDSRVRPIQLEHGGASRARNAALRLAAGEIVAYLDSDNRWSSDYLLIMVHSLLDAPEASCAYTGLRVRDIERGTDSLLLYPYDRATLLQRNTIDLNVFVHRRGLFEQLGGFREDLPVLHDWDLILRYTREREPLLVECVLATYSLRGAEDQLTSRPELLEDYQRVRALHGD